MNKQFCRFMIYFLLVVFIPAVSLAGGQTLQKIRSYEGITEYTLDNGLGVLLIPDNSTDTVTVNITYLVGSRHENYGETGSAHLLEHMVFKGTPTFPNLKGELIDRGASYNGSTWYDRTNYYETLPASDENLEFGIRLEADRMLNSFVTKKKLETEMTVVRNEFEISENMPSSVLEERIFSTAYLFHGYGHPTIGARSDIENIPIERLQAFYKNYYQPDNAILVVSGKFDENKALDYIKKYFGALSRPERRLIRTYTEEPPQDGEREVTLRRVGDVGIFGVFYHAPAAAHPDTAAITVLASVLGNRPSGRLYKALVETGKASQVNHRTFLRQEPGSIMFTARILKEKSIKDVRTTMLSVLKEIHAKPVTEKEVERAKTEILKNMKLLMADSRRFAIQMSEWASRGDWRLFFLHRDRIQKVTAKDVQKAAAYYLKPENRTIGTYIPTRKPQFVEIPETGNISTMLKDYKQEIKKVAQETFELTPANLEKHTLRKKLANGMQVAVLSKPSRGGRVNAQLSFPVSNEKDLLSGQRGINDFVASMLLRGTLKHSRSQIKETFDRLKANVRIYGSNNSTSVYIETTKENLIQVFNLLVEVLKEPKFDEKEFAILKEETMSGLDRQKNEPMFIAFRVLSNHMYPKDHINYQPTIEEEIAFTRKCSLDSLRSFYSDYYGMGNARLAVVGDVDAEPLIALCEKELAPWTGKKHNELAAAIYPGKRIVINKNVETPDKTSGTIALGMNIKLNQDDPDNAALKLADYLLGGKGMTSRLTGRIREKEGLSYAVFSFFSPGYLGDCGRFVAFAMTAPQNLAKTEKIFFEEFDKVLKDGFTEKELEIGKEAYLKRQQVSFSRDLTLASQVSRDLLYGKTFNDLEKLYKDIRNLTLEQVNAVLKKYLDPGQISVVKAGDFSKLAKEKK